VQARDIPARNAYFFSSQTAIAEHKSQAQVKTIERKRRRAEIILRSKIRNKVITCAASLLGAL